MKIKMIAGQRSNVEIGKTSRRKKNSSRNIESCTEWSGSVMGFGKFEN